MIRCILDISRSQQKSRTRKKSLYPRCILLAMLFVPGLANASHSLVDNPDLIDNRFETYLLQPCIDGPAALINRDWSFEEIVDYNNRVCSKVFTTGTFNGAGGGVEGYASSSNIGSVAAQTKTSDSVAQQQISSVQDRLNEIQEEDEPQGGWGLLLSVQKGETDRAATNSETGFESELDGVVVGVDYRFNDQLVAGLAIGSTSDDAKYDSNAGFLKTESKSFIGYVTYVINDHAYVDAYLGTAPLEYSNSREIGISGVGDEFDISGTITSKFDGKQQLMGISGGYDWFLGDSTVGVFAALDNSETDVDGYTEQGTTDLELVYPDQTSKSSLLSLGVNASHVIDVGWAAVIPNISIATVRQSEDDTRTFDARLVIMPAVDTSSLTLETDSPDRNYVLTSVGVVVAMNSGTQYFASYETLSSHDFLDTWAFAAGVLLEF